MKIDRQKTARFTLACAAAACAALGTGNLKAQAATSPAPLLLTATNGTNNYLAVINTRNQQIVYVPTGGMGGASGNAGGVAVQGSLAAVINFGSSTVSIFQRKGNSMQPVQTVKTSSQPVSVTFGHGHLVVLGQTTADSFPVYGNTVGNNDGTVGLEPRR